MLNAQNGQPKSVDPSIKDLLNTLLNGKGELDPTALGTVFHKVLENNFSPEGVAKFKERAASDKLTPERLDRITKTIKEMKQVLSTNMLEHGADPMTDRLTLAILGGLSQEIGTRLIPGFAENLGRSLLEFSGAAVIEIDLGGN